MVKKMLTEAEQKKQEIDILMEGWMSKAAEDHRRLANRFEKIGLTQEDIQKPNDKIDHSKQMRSSNADFMRNMFAKLEAINEGEVDEKEVEVDESKDDCGCGNSNCKGNCGNPGCKCGD